MVHEVLQSYLREIETGGATIQYEINSWKDLEKWFLAQLELQKSYEMTRGCPFGTVGNEVTEKDELIRQDLNVLFEGLKSRMAAFFLQGRGKGELAKQADVRHMDDLCMSTIQGSTRRVRLHVDIPR